MTYSSIRDNRKNGTVGDFLKAVISTNSEVAIVSAYFTIYAYHQLKDQLDGIKSLRFLFGEPAFIKSIDPDKVNTREFKIEDDKLVIPLERRLKQKNIARECADWIAKKTEIRSMVKPKFLHGKLYHVTQESGIEKAVAGSSNFTVNGLGLGGTKNIELNLIIDSDRDRQELKQWFDGIWNDSTGLVEDVKDQVLAYLWQLYAENEPEFIYFKTLYHIFEDYLEENIDETDQWQVGKKLKFDLADLRLEEWVADLKNDKDALVDLLNNARAVDPSRDAKLKELKDLIKSKINAPTNPGNKKVIVFTAFADTAQYLYDNLKNWIKTELNLHCALICGSFTQTAFGKNDYDSILVNFSPLSKKRAQMNQKMMNNSEKSAEIDILIATDCISEGQNLQDCDFLINYDIHWNPVRIIQRFGRIDRLGSVNKSIQLVNFWPTRDLDNYINLKERVEARMALVDVTATGEDNILNAEQLEELITDDLKFRNRQLKKLQSEVLDLEEIEETVSLTDFTLDDFRIELLNFIESNRKRLKNSPLGLYAIVPAPGGAYAGLIIDRPFTPSEQDIIKPGAIFCLAQKETAEGNAEVNPLNPYFLVYIRDDGTVRYNYTNAKQILEVFRLLCQEQKKPYEELCTLFDNETANGEKMEKYTDLLQKAVKEIIHVYKKKGYAKLTTDRGAVLVPKTKQVNEMKDFELITWLIVR